jgi:ribosomal protein S18 acetylase RimI-like enzyme
MSFTLRRVAEADLDALALVGAATFLDAFAGVLDGQAILAHCAREHSVGRYRDYLAAGATAWLAEATPGGAPIGYALLGAVQLPGANTEHDIELKRIYALSRYHGSGLGADLLGRAVDEARQCGRKRLLLGVYSRNARALAFYAKHGFSRVGTRTFQVGEQTYDDFVMAKPLELDDRSRSPKF